jgi:TetR/AcrR family transcriptional regulator
MHPIPVPEVADTRPAPGRPRDKQASHRRILDAARTVFAREGYRDAALAEIAREAGLGKSSLYRHADSKAELFVEVLLDQAAARAERTARCDGSATTAEAQLRLFAEDLLAEWREHGPMRTLLWAIDNQDLIGDVSPRLLARVRETWEAQLETLSSVVRRGVESGEFRPCDPHVTAFVLLNLGNLLFELSASPVRRRLLRAPVERAFESALSLVLAGLRRA